LGKTISQAGGSLKHKGAKFNHCAEHPILNVTDGIVKKPWEDGVQ